MTYTAQDIANIITNSHFNSGDLQELLYAVESRVDYNEQFCCLLDETANNMIEMVADTGYNFSIKDNRTGAVIYVDTDSIFCNDKNRTIFIGKEQ